LATLTIITSFDGSFFQAPGPSTLLTIQILLTLEVQCQQAGSENVEIHQGIVVLNLVLAV